MAEQVLKSQNNFQVGGLKQWWRQQNQGNRLVSLFIFLPPALLLFTIFVVMPLGEAAFYSFFKWRGYGSPDNFIGLLNYERIVGHSVFQTSLRNTMLIIVVSLVIQLPLALAAALAIYKQTWFNNVLRLIFFLPFILAEVVAGLIWRFVFDGDYGLMGSFSELMGSETIYVLADKEWALYAILLVMVWKYFGFHMMIYIAGLQSVPSDLLEAAKLDGASRWQLIRHIKVPLLWPAITVSIFFSVIGSFQAFDIIMPLTGGGPSHATHSLVTYLYQFGMARMKVGFGSAVGVILFFICVIFAFTYRRKFMNENENKEAV